VSTLGYLLKHAYLRYAEIAAAALEPLGISGPEATVLRNIATQAPESQSEIARRMDVDRTTMVGLIDSLERKELVRRRQDPADRRRNVIEATGAGRDATRGAEEAAATAERQFLSGLPADQAQGFKAALEALLRHE
jgi:DNA-binding MarR family transcriptional regulator